MITATMLAFDAGSLTELAVATSRTPAATHSRDFTVMPSSGLSIGTSHFGGVSGESTTTVGWRNTLGG
eukprot:13773432-Alexandrium_andersonii.AAC.1